MAKNAFIIISIIILLSMHRANEINFDEVQYGDKTEIIYKDTDLPVILYCKLDKDYKDLNIAIQFKDNSLQVEGEYSTSPIRIVGTIMAEDNKNLLKKKGDMDMEYESDKLFYGNFDPIIKTALIFLSKEKIDSYNITLNPIIYLLIEKAEIYNDKSFKYFSIETHVAEINDDNAIPAEKVYHHGKLGVRQQIVYHKLKLKKNIISGAYHPMKIHIAVNGVELDCSINRKKGSLNNDDFYATGYSEIGGRVSFIFYPPNIDSDYIYLNIFRKEGVIPNEKLSNYVFRYINDESDIEFIDFIMMSADLIIEEKKVDKYNYTDVITCTFSPILNQQEGMNVTYFLKVVDNSTYIYPEELITIAVTESPYSFAYKRNPSPNVPEERDKIQMSIKGNFSNWCAINIIAQIQNNDNMQYLSYQSIINIRESPEKENKEETNIDPDEDSNEEIKGDSEDISDEDSNEEIKGDSENISDEDSNEEIKGDSDEVSDEGIDSSECIEYTQCKEKEETDHCKCISCFEGYYLEDNKCKKCKDNCKTCENINKCNSCENGYALEKNICIKCHDDCELCSSPSINDNEQKCISCKNKGKLLYENNCIDNCLDGFYIYNGKECQKCNEHCKTCTKGEENNNENCILCDLNSEYKYLIDAEGFGKNCVKECPNKTILKDGKCIINSLDQEEESNNLVVIIIPSIIAFIIIIGIIILLIYRRRKKEDLNDIHTLKDELRQPLELRPQFEE